MRRYTILFNGLKFSFITNQTISDEIIIDMILKADAFL
ncbi:hypothetical protein CSG_9990 [Campylobacter fetus subsp. venerealis str. 84-112]|nr:hypothetical protein CSG_9990 [Campylobacter fetus subsp. venerealis str. 84-112]